MYKVGNFLILLGIFLVVLYVLSDIAGAPSFGLLVAGVACTALGVWVRSLRNPEDMPRSERFQTIKRMKNRPPKVKKKKEEKADHQEGQ